MTDQTPIDPLDPDFARRAAAAAKRMVRQMCGDAPVQQVDTSLVGHNPDGICTDIFHWTDEADFLAQHAALREKIMRMAKQLPLGRSKESSAGSAAGEDGDG